jgi:hypothetical protein
MSEHDLLALFIRAVPEALPNVRVFRRNIIRRKVMINRIPVMLVNGIPGQGDAYAIVKGGRHIEIEAKSSKGVMRPGQKRWRLFCGIWGITHLVVKGSKDELVEETVARWVEELRAVL